MAKYSINLHTKTNPDELFFIIQLLDKLLHDYIERFTKGVNAIPGYNDIVAICALKKGLLLDSPLVEEMCNWRPNSITEALTQAQG